MQKLWSWIVTIPFLLTFGLVLAVYEVAGRMVRPFSLTGFEWVMAALQRTLVGVYRVFGTRVDVDRSKEIKSRTGYVIISNHQSLFDIVLIGGFMFSNLPKYVSKAELGRWIPAVSLNLKQGGHALIDRGDGRRAVAEIAALGQRVQERNRSAAIFPEGTRSRDGKLKPFRRTGAVALLRAADRLEVVPVAVHGSWRLNRMWPFRPGSQVRISLGDPIPRTNGDATAIVDEARKWIDERLQQWERTNRFA